MDRKYFIFPFLLLLMFATSYSQNTKTIIINGIIKEKITQENIIGATIYQPNSNNVTLSDVSGNFTLHLAYMPKFDIIISYVGFRSDTITFSAQRDTNLIVFLDAISLATVEVNAKKTNLAERLTSLAVPMQQLKSIPAFLGEADVLRGLTMLPGVSNGTEGSVGLNVRGGSPEQNLILIDGAPIYNATHLFGFLSSFNADAVKKVELYKGNFPAKYGGRLASVIDINFKDGNKQRRNIEVGIGAMNAKIFIETPIKKDRSSIMFAARSSYLDLVTLKSKNEFYKAVGNTYRNYRFWDLNVKSNFLVGKNGSLSFGYFHTQDFFIYKERPKPSLTTENTIRWSSDVGNIRYIQPLGRKFILNSQLTFNRYDYNFAINSILDSLATDDDYDLDAHSRTTIYDIGQKNNINWSVSSKLNINFGTDVYQQFFIPNQIAISVNKENIAFDAETHQSRKSLNVALFTDIEYKWSKSFTSAIGIRAVNYFIDKVNYHFIEPRFYNTVNVNDKNSIKGGISIMNQPLHILSSNTLGFTNDAWVPATAIIPPSTAIQYAIGYIRDLPSLKSYISIETYYKSMKNLIDYSEGANPFIDNATKGFEKIVEKNGIGRAYGLELLLHKEFGRWNGMLAYTLSKTERRFDKINYGRWYRSRFDRTHDFEITANYEVTKKWSISSTFIYNTGTPITGANYIVAGYDDKSKYPEYIYFTNIYKAKNNLRLPSYHRMDIAINYKKIRKKSERTWSFGAYNVYNRKNVIATEYKTNEVFKNNKYIYGLNGLYVNAGYNNKTLFPLIPYITYNIKIK